MNLQDRVERILIQMVEGEWGDVTGPDFYILRTEDYLTDADVVIPLQWMLCTKHVSQARQAIRRMVRDVRQALDGVEALLDTIDAAEAEATATGHSNWAPLLAILKAPFPLERPEVCDPSFLPCLVVMLRDVLFDGSWETHNRWIEEQGGDEQRAQNLPINRSLQQFEETYGVNLTDLLFSERDKAEHEAMREEYRRQGWKPPRSQEGEDTGSIR